MEARRRLRRAKSRVLGPYPDGKKWRIVLFDQGKRTSFLADTVADAEAMKAHRLARLVDRSLTSISAALEEYLAERDTGDLLPGSLYRLSQKLYLFLPIERTLGEITPEVAYGLYRDATQRMTRFGKPPSPNTHRSALRAVRAFFRWCVGRGKMRSNPFDTVKPVGKVRYGKPQLRLDEARRLSRILLQHADAGDVAALGLLVQMVLGLRSAEVLALRVRDLDNGGNDLWVEGTKTRNARRPLEIKWEPLRQRLMRLCQGQEPHLLMFGSQRERPYFTTFLYFALRKYCQLAGVPVVCPHSLRGLHSTIAMARGASSRFVAEALGHGSDEVTKRHYIDGETVRNSTIERVAELLGQDPASDQRPALVGPELVQLAAALRSLSREQRNALFELIQDTDGR